MSKNYILSYIQFIKIAKQVSETSLKFEICVFGKRELIYFNACCAALTEIKILKLRKLISYTLPCKMTS